MQEAIQAAKHPLRPTVALPDYEHQWEDGDNYLEVDPQTEHLHQTVVLTWGILANALAGVNDFIHAYPGLSLVFKMYTWAKDELGRDDEIYVGWGQLSFFLGPTGGIHVDSRRRRDQIGLEEGCGLG